MQNRGRNATGERPPGAGAPCCRRLALLAVLALMAPLVAARAEPPRLPPAGRSRLRDLELTVSARRALQQDPSLGPLHVGVLVVDGVATVWGPVPTAADVRRAVKALEAVPGIATVRSELRLEKGQPKSARTYAEGGHMGEDPNGDRLVANWLRSHLLRT